MLTKHGGHGEELGFRAYLVGGGHLLLVHTEHLVHVVDRGGGAQHLPLGLVLLAVHDLRCMGPGL